MNNQERKQLRIRRSKDRKAEKRKPRIEKYGTFENVNTIQNHLHSLQKRRKDTEWKGSVQSYIQHAPVKIYRAKHDLNDGVLNVNQTIRHLVVNERGKRRDCHAIMIDSRVIQGSLCDSSITPLTQPSLIYDNPASTKGKGVSFARRRVDCHLQKEIREHGNDFHVLLYDFHGFFDSIRHSRCRYELGKAGQDDRLQALTMYFIKMYQKQDISTIADPEERERRIAELENDEAIGATLGSQISQDMALVIPNELDHTVKDKERMKHHIRYMDDGYTSGTKERLTALLDTIREVCNRLGLELNEKKTRIVKASRGFTFLKVLYIVTDTNRIVKKMAKSGIVRMRQKLKKFRRLVDLGKMRLDDAYTSFKSWFGNARKIAHTYRTRKAMLNLYNRLFHQYRTGGMIA